jgi:hypothetical protein
MTLDQLFNDEISTHAVGLSDDDCLVAAVILQGDLERDADLKTASRAARLVLTASSDQIATRLLEVFAPDVENLALVCSRMVKHLCLPWSGEVSSLEAALQLHPRTRVAGEFLAHRVRADLMRPRFDPHAAASWKLSQNGALFIADVSDSALLRNIVRESNDPLPALARLAEIKDAESIRSLLHTMHSQVAGPVWVAGVRPLPSAPRRALLLEVLLLCKAKPHLRMLVQDELEEMDRTTLAQSKAR